MTSDAKIGLLLGLVFIFIIALLVNGLPSFHKDKPTNELTTNIVRLRSDTPAIAAKERKISRDVIEPSVRYSRPLNRNTPQPKPIEEKQTVKPEQIQPPKPKTCVVAESDSLASIAQKFYGPIEGNRKVNVDKIFAANKDILKSPDAIYPGQELIIPPLAVSLTARNSVSQIISSPLLESVTFVGRRHLTTLPDSREKDALYIVAEGDSLWKIAADKLGDGNRYTEILELNSAIIQNENYLEVGMRLRLPSK